MQRYYQKNKARVLETVAEYRRNNPDKVRDSKLRGTFGISLADYNRMLREQNDVCAICRCKETMVWRGKIRALAVDHDHVTGAVRRLLCRRCNSILGFVNDSSLLLRTAADYLEKHRAQ